MATPETPAPAGTTGAREAHPSAGPSRPPLPPRPEGLERRAGLLLLTLLALVLGAAVYLLYARGAFEPTQRLYLITDDSEGVTVGMDLVFSGFPVGRVRRIELTPSGQARIVVDVPRKDAHWLRESSVFTLTRGLLGNTSLRAYSGVLSDPPLPPAAERRVLQGDALAEIPRLLGQVRDLVANLSALTADDSALAATLAHTRSIAGKLDGPGGALGVLMGNPADAQRVLRTLDRTNQLLARLDALVVRTDGVVEQAGTQLFGPQGLAQDARLSVQQLQGLLAEARGSLQRVDALLQEAQATARNVRVATTDLDVMRAEVEASLRKVDGLIGELGRKWPFKRDAELKLP